MLDLAFITIQNKIVKTMAGTRIKNYDKLLEKVKNRRSDFDIQGKFQKSILTESFSKSGIPKTIKYVYESMEPVTDEYTQKTFSEAERVQSQITDGIRTAGGVIQSVKFDYQGSVPSNTHIKVHSDLDILVIHDEFYYGDPMVAPKIPYYGEPYKELKELRTNIFNRLSSRFYAATVSNEKPKCIQISGGSLQRKFDVLVCSRFNSQEYVTTKFDHLRAISLYDNNANSCQEDHPFKHIYAVNKKDSLFYIDGNFKKVVRLLKSLKVDADVFIDLSSFMITSVMYHMSDLEYMAMDDKMSTLLVNSSGHLDKILTNKEYREKLMSPNGEEPLFKGDYTHTLTEIRKLKKELDTTIIDLAKDLQEIDSHVSRQQLEKAGPAYDDAYMMNRAYNVLNESQMNYHTIY